MFKNFYKKYLERYDNPAKKIAGYLISILIIFLGSKVISNAHFFNIQLINIPLKLILLLLIIIINFISLEKLILLLNLKPELTKKEFEKMMKKVDSNSEIISRELGKKKPNKKIIEKYEKQKENLIKTLNRHKIRFDNYLEFFIFNLVIMTWETEFSYVIKKTFKSLIAQIKNTFSKNKKGTYFAWAVILDKKRKEKLYWFCSYPN